MRFEIRFMVLLLAVMGYFEWNDWLKVGDLYLFFWTGVLLPLSILYDPKRGKK